MGVVACFPVVRLGRGHPGQVLVGAGLTGVVVLCGEQVQCTLVVGARRVGLAQSVVRKPETTVGMRQSGPVRLAAGGIQRGALDVGQRPPVRLPVKEGGDGRSELPGMGVEAPDGGLLDEGKQHTVFGGEPGQRLPVVREFLGAGARLGGRQLDRVRLGGQQYVGGTGGMQVVVEHPMRCRAPVGVGLFAVGQFGGVVAKEVMEGVPARGVLGEQVRADQFGQQFASAGRRYPGQARQRRQCDIRPRMQAEKPEEAGRLSAQRPVGPGEHRPCLGGGIPAVEGVQAVVGICQLGGERGQREVGLRTGTGGHDGKCQWQPGAVGDDRVHRGGFGGHAGGIETAGQQFAGLDRAEQVDGQQTGAFGRGQAGEPVPAGDQRQATRCAGQQRADLLGIPGVVQHDKYPAAAQQAAVQAGLCLQTGRDAGRRHPEGVQKPPHRLRRADHRPAGIEPSQVHIQLPIGKRLPNPARPMHRERCLAHPGGARHRRNDRGTRPSPACGVRTGQEVVQLGEFAAAAGENRYGRR